VAGLWVFCGCFVGGLADWWIGGLWIGGLVVCGLVVCGWFVDWCFGGLVFCGLADWWIGGLVDWCFVDWRIGGLVDWRIGGLVFCGLWGLFSFCLSRLAQPFLKVEMVDKLKLGWNIFLWINVALKVSTLVRPIP
jgi:hypothetical protein